MWIAFKVFAINASDPKTISTGTFYMYVCIVTHDMCFRTEHKNQMWPNVQMCPTPLNAQRLAKCFEKL